MRRRISMPCRGRGHGQVAVLEGESFICSFRITLPPSVLIDFTSQQSGAIPSPMKSLIFFSKLALLGALFSATAAQAEQRLTAYTKATLRAAYAACWEHEIKGSILVMGADGKACRIEA